MKGELIQNKTGNSFGHIVPGSKVVRHSGNKIYDVGEIVGDQASLYYDNKLVGWFPIAGLKAV
ncbi:MAG: hypothetical protein PHW47_06720 [Lachnospira sp.]|nr:hypothetical protein [Lachnospira sp.]